MVTRERVGQIDLSNHAYRLRGEARRENRGMKYRGPERRVDLTGDLGAFGAPKIAPMSVPKSIDRSARRQHAVRIGWEKPEVVVVDNSAPVRSMVATQAAVRPQVRMSDAPAMPQQRGTWPNGMPRF